MQEIRYESTKKKKIKDYLSNSALPGEKAMVRIQTCRCIIM